MRYIIGIDLGTTNSSVSYIDTLEAKAAVRLLRIPQLVAEGRIEALSVLPSFCYLSAAHENLKGSSEPSTIVGQFAKNHGAKIPTRLVHSAKSWLCHSGVNRRDKILPLQSDDESRRMSPVEASALYLSHIRDVWNSEIAKKDSAFEFENQEIVLTVPASFDEVARELTVEAARKAGCVHITLLEEPQAAFYSWIAQHEQQWEKAFKIGSQVLVCDVGGGTTDFSIIDVISIDGKLSFRRMAVGDHLLLGGDNMDAAVAHLAEDKLSVKGHELSSTHRLQLLHASRRAKEELLEVKQEETSDTSSRILLQKGGSGVVQGTLSVDLLQSEVQKLLQDRFFGSYSWEEALKLQKASKKHSMGLPYETESSIIKHLAYFLWENKNDHGVIKPDFILFNGGVMKSALFQKSVVDALEEWFPDHPLQILSSYNLDLAVARGAAYYGKVRRGLGVKIGGGLARGYYIVVDTQNNQGGMTPMALTLMPRGSDEGFVFEPTMTFMLMPNTPISFQVCTSHTRLHDNVGDLIPVEQTEMRFLPMIRTMLRFGKKQFTAERQEKIPVHLQARLTSIGTIEIALKSTISEHKWALEFQVRGAAGQEEAPSSPSNDKNAKNKPDQTFDADFLKESEKLIIQVFTQDHSAIKPKQLMEKIEELLSMPRREWPLSVMRGLFDIVLKIGNGRKLSGEHRERWWNIVGFLLRPGYGYALDDFRMRELWKIILAEGKEPFTLEQQIQLWICYRRIAGGLNKGQQMQIASDLMSSILSKRSGKIEVKTKGEIYPYSEKIRALGALELLDNPTKIRLGNALIQRIQSDEGIPADYWALGRIGARHLLYGSIVNVIPHDICEHWIDKLLDKNTLSGEDEKRHVFLIEQLARKTEHREINVSMRCVEKIVEKFKNSEQIARLEAVLRKENALTQTEQEYVFGDQLPAGLFLIDRGAACL